MRSFFWKTLCKGKRSFLRFLNYKHRKKLQRDALESRYWSLFVPLFVKVCLKQYVGSTVARIRLRFNQYKSSVKLNGEGRRGFKIEKLIEHFLLLSHNRTHEDIKVQKIGHLIQTIKKIGKTFGFSIWTLCIQNFSIKNAR